MIKSIINLSMMGLLVLFAASADADHDSGYYGRGYCPDYGGYYSYGRESRGYDGYSRRYSDTYYRHDRRYRDHHRRYYDYDHDSDSDSDSY